MIDDKTLLQTDTTVIAGLLILLTIYSLKYPITRQAKGEMKTLAVAIKASIVPFSLSALFILFVKDFRYALGAVGIGLIYLRLGHKSMFSFTNQDYL